MAVSVHFMNADDTLDVDLGGAHNVGDIRALLAVHPRIARPKHLVQLVPDNGKARRLTDRESVQSLLDSQESPVSLCVIFAPDNLQHPCPSWRVAEAAAYGELGEIAASRIDAVASLLGDRERSVRVAAADAVSRMGTAADVHANKIADILLREGSLECAIEAHERMGSMSRARLVDALLTGNLGPQGKLDVCRALISMNQDWVPRDASVVASAAKDCSNMKITKCSGSQRKSASAAKVCNCINEDMKRTASEVLAKMILIGTNVLYAGELKNFAKSIIYAAVQATNGNLEEATMQLWAVRALMGGSTPSVPVLEDVETAWGEHESEADLFMIQVRQFYEHERDKTNHVRPSQSEHSEDEDGNEVEIEEKVDLDDEDKWEWETVATDDQDDSEE